MSRSYVSVRPKSDWVYTVNCLMALFDVSRNTVSAWIKQGLMRSKSGRHYIFNGAEVIRFHKERRERTKRQLRFGEFKCLHCKIAAFPDISTIKFLVSGSKVSLVTASCLDCGEQVSKLHTEIDCDRIQKYLDTGTTLGPADEEVAPLPTGIGNDGASFSKPMFTINDGIIFGWIKFAERLDPKTISAHLHSIRELERFFHGKPFENITKDDISRYRDHMKARATADADAPLSVSTVRHRTSHLKAFFEWLLKQPEIKKMDVTLPDYCALPKRFSANALPAEERPVPTIAQAEKMLQMMPQKTILQRRARAMFATSFTGALRADTTTSLLIKHFDVKNRQVIQNAQESRTKNGKSLNIYWFPVAPVFFEVMCDWVHELDSLGFRKDDALFPPDADLKNPPLEGRPKIKAMKSTSAIELAFKTAGGLIGAIFSPHSAKHCIGRLMHEFCKTPKERKAWSTNMGHDAEVVTETYYNKVPAAEIRDIFRAFHCTPTEPLQNMELMLQYHEHKLALGSPEFRRAEKLVNERKARSQPKNDEVIEYDQAVNRRLP